MLFNITKLYRNLAWLDKNVWLSDRFGLGFASNFFLNFLYISVGGRYGHRGKSKPETIGCGYDFNPGE